MGSNAAVLKATYSMRTSQEEAIADVDQLFIIKSFHKTTLEGTLKNLLKKSKCTWLASNFVDVLFFRLKLLPSLCVASSTHHIFSNWDVQLISEFVFDKTNISTKSGKFLNHSKKGTMTGKDSRISVIKVYNVS